MRRWPLRSRERPRPATTQPKASLSLPMIRSIEPGPRGSGIPVPWTRAPLRARRRPGRDASLDRPREDSADGMFFAR
jgi:hypothetical protein